MEITISLYLHNIKMEKSKSHFKDTILAIIILISWVSFPFFTYDNETILLNFVPLLILIIQLVFLFFYRNRKALFMILLNPVVLFAVYYTIKPTMNYLRKKPTLIHCCSNLSEAPSFDYEKSVYLDYYDDDCDWEGLYHYTLDINNFVTNGLVSTFGNPAKK